MELLNDRLPTIDIVINQLKSAINHASISFKHASPRQHLTLGCPRLAGAGSSSWGRGILLLWEQGDQQCPSDRWFTGDDLIQHRKALRHRCVRPRVPWQENLAQAVQRSIL